MTINYIMNSLQAKVKAIPTIRRLREEAGITQLELSQMVGVTETSIQNWERGRAGVEQIERVIKLCNALKCKPEELIEYVEIPDLELEGRGISKSEKGNINQSTTVVAEIVEDKTRKTQPSSTLATGRGLSTPKKSMN